MSLRCNSDTEDRDSDSGSERKEAQLCNPALKGLGLEGVMENYLQNSSQKLHSRHNKTHFSQNNLTIKQIKHTCENNLTLKQKWVNKTDTTTTVKN